MSEERGLRVVGGLAVVTQVQQTLGAVEVRRFDALATQARVAPVRRLRHRLRRLAHARRVAAAASVSGVRRRRQRRYGRAAGREPGHVTAGGAGDEASRPGTRGAVIVGRHDAVESPVVGQAVLAERVSTVEMARTRREGRLETQQTAELTARLGCLQFAIRRAAARLASVAAAGGHVGVLAGGSRLAAAHARRRAAQPRSRL